MSTTLVSGVKPTGRPHLGNYFGAMRQFVSLQEQCDRRFIFIADLHGLNFIQNGEEMRQNILDLMIDYLAIGLDPAKVTLFQQSAVPAHAELCWVFDAITTMPYLMRAHAFKDAEAKDKEISVGTFNYPMLMAADILLYQADVVPVGQDQKQHVEYARDTAQKFNRIFGGVVGADADENGILKLPKEMIMEDVAIVPGIDGRKMSKSYGNTIGLFASDDEIRKQVMAIVTDSSGGVPTNVRAIHELIKPAAELDALYAEKAGKYKDLKEVLVADLITFIAPLRERRAAIAADPEKVKAILRAGAEKARAAAEETMTKVRQAIGTAL
jgi:tryptophanyl-tRNA synthetase